MDHLFHSIMIPPPDEPIPMLGDVPVEELLLALQADLDSLPQPVVNEPKRRTKPTLQTKILNKLGKLVEEAHTAGLTIKYTVERG